MKKTAVKVKTAKVIRVVGYMSKVDSMNEGKLQEFKARQYMIR